MHRQQVRARATRTQEPRQQSGEVTGLACDAIPPAQGRERVLVAGRDGPHESPRVGHRQLRLGDAEPFRHRFQQGRRGPELRKVDRSQSLRRGQPHILPVHDHGGLDHGQTRVRAAFRRPGHCLHGLDVVAEPRDPFGELDRWMRGGPHRGVGCLGGEFEQWPRRGRIARDHRHGAFRQRAAGLGHSPEHRPTRPQTVEHQDDRGCGQAGEHGEHHTLSGGPMHPPAPRWRTLIGGGEGVVHARTLAQIGRTMG